MELARRAADGDERSWREIYDATSDRLFSLLCSVVQDRDEALDLLQETYLRAFRRIEGYRGDAPLEAWLRVIAIRRAFDWRRTVLKRILRTSRLTESSASVDPVGPAVAEAESARPALMLALAGISPHQRAALLLRECEGLSFREVAKAIGCKESTARVHHAKARERMRIALGGAWDGGLGTASGGGIEIDREAGSGKADCLEGQTT